MNSRPIAISLLVVFIIGLVLASRALFVVRVDQFAIVTEFGDPIRIIDTPGLNFMIPVVQQVKYMDKRIRGWDDTDRDTQTGETHPIEYTVFARWRISDALKYYEAVGNVRNAHGHMDSIISDQIQAAVRRHKIASIVRETGRAFQRRKSVDLKDIFGQYRLCEPAVNPEFGKALSGVSATQKLLDNAAAKNIDDAQAMRSHVVEGILKASNTGLVAFGIIIEDLHFKYLNYSPRVQDEIIKKIQSDRKEDIASYYEVGKECVGYIRGVTDTEKGEINGEAERRVREIDGQAVADAIKIKSGAFESNPGFYRFIRSLELYERSLHGRTSMIMSMDSPILQLMKNARVMADVPKKARPAKKKKATPKKAAP